MCSPLQEVTAYKDCAGDVHATKIQALSSCIATNMCHKHSPYSRVSRWDVQQVLEGILDSDFTPEAFTFLAVDIKEPEGYNGPGMYEAQAKWDRTTPKPGFPSASTFTFKGKKTEFHTSTLRFQADSLEEAKSFLDLDEVEYVKWIPQYKFDGNNILE